MTEEEIMQMVQEQRNQMARNDKERDRGLKVPDDVKCLYDIQYSKDAELCKLDLYRPKKAGKKKLPVIVSVHGGGWIYGDKELYSFYCMELARRGFAVVNFTYRLSPECKFPSALIDTNNVFKWVLKNAAEYNLDEKNIFATGDSAGGNYLAIYAEAATNKKFANEFPFKVPARLKFNALYLNCGFYDFTLDRSSDPGPSALLKALMPYGGTDHEALVASPAKNVSPDFPPSFVVTAECDFLRPMATLMATALCNAGVEFRYKCYFSAKEKLFHVFMLNLKCRESAPCIDEQCDFFRSYIK